MLSSCEVSPRQNDEDQHKLAEAFNNVAAAWKKVPFDRERDMGVVDGKKMYLEELKERAGQLSPRFTSGTGQKFL
ncbi:unnamed protein product [Haemonchus placei]|uniref:HMG box domain-containing protein n=1 Tax=Haemonchus placei TaxID=6290 RepID=A0A0N4VYM7_HAEPC|nr:unnamed protein product [Haemonchus placei]